MGYRLWALELRKAVSPMLKESSRIEPKCAKYFGAREQWIFLNLFLCDHSKVIYSVYRFQIFQNFFDNDFLIENFQDFEDFSSFYLPNDGLIFLSFSKFSKFSKLLTPLNFENFDRIFRELHRTRNRD